MHYATLFETRAPQPSKPRVKIDLVGDELHLDWKQGGLGVAGFLILWLTGWTGGCGFLVTEIVKDPTWFMALFATPFFVAWFVVAGLIIRLLFGRQLLVIARGELRVSSRALVTYSRRIVPLEEVERAAADSVFESDSDGPGRFFGIVSITTVGKPIHFAKEIKEAEAAWLAEVINQCLDRLAPERAALAAISAAHEELAADYQAAGTVAESFDDDFSESGVLVFQPGRERRALPSDSNFQLERAGRSVQFTCRGRWSLGAIAGATCINLFWNGIVAVFVVQLFKEFEWFLCLFLIPFEIIGLCMFGYWIAMITAPAWGFRYTFRAGQIERHSWAFLFERAKRWEFDRIERVEISESEEDGTKRTGFPPNMTSDSGYQVAWIDTENRIVTAIDSLTKGEALWMADTVMSERPEMFVRR